MNNNKQSSVEWLIAELGEYFPHEIGGIELMVKQAKAMQEKQIIEFVYSAVRKVLDEDRQNPFNLKQYYNETYGDEQDKSN